MFRKREGILQVNTPVLHEAGFLEEIRALRFGNASAEVGWNQRHMRHRSRNSVSLQRVCGLGRGSFLGAALSDVKLCNKLWSNLF